MLPSASRCGKAAALLVQALNVESKDDGHIAALRTTLAREVAQYELEVQKSFPAMQACDDEREGYNKLQREVDAEIEATKTEIQRLREELDGEKLVRRRREEYEALAKEVNRHPSKRKCVEEIEQLEGKKRAIESMRGGYQSQVDMRKRQFHLLLQTLFDLQESLGDEEEEQAKP